MKNGRSHEPGENNLIDNVFSKPLTRVFLVTLEPRGFETYENTGLALGGISLSLRYGSIFVIESGAQLPDSSVSIVFSESEESPAGARVRILETRASDGSPIFKLMNLTNERQTWQFFVTLSPQGVTQNDFSRMLFAFSQKMTAMETEIGLLKKSLEGAKQEIAECAKKTWVEENFSKHIYVKFHKGAAGGFALGKKEKLTSFAFFPVIESGGTRHFIIGTNTPDSSVTDGGIFSYIGQQASFATSSIPPWPV